MDSTVLPLTVASAGDELQIHSVRGCNGETQRLRELGMLEGRTVRIIGNYDSLVCQIGTCRFGLGRNVAQHVMVTPLPESS